MSHAVGGLAAGPPGAGARPAARSETLRRAEEEAERAEQRPAYRALARLGLCARAIVYLFLSGISFDIAVNHRAPARDDSNGAFSVIARQSGGTVLLGMLALGLAAYGFWRVVQAVAQQPGNKETSALKRLGYLASGVAYFALCAEAVQLIAGSSSNGPSQRPQPIVASVLRFTGGPELIGLIGVGAAAGGVSLAAWGAWHDYGKVLRYDAMPIRMRTVARVTGSIGDAARGAAVVLVAVYLVGSAVSDDPAKAKALGGAFQSLVTFTGGPELLGLVAAGLVCFAAYTLVETRYRRLSSSATGAAPARATSPHARDDGHSR